MLTLREERKRRRGGGGCGRCDSSSLYGHMQPWHGHSRGKTCSFRAYINTPALLPSPPSSRPREEEGNEEKRNAVEFESKCVDTFLSFRSIERLCTFCNVRKCSAGSLVLVISLAGGGLDGRVRLGYKFIWKSPTKSLRKSD